MKGQLSQSTVIAITCMAFISSCDLELDGQNEVIEPNAQTVQKLVPIPTEISLIQTGTYNETALINGQEVGLSGKYYYPTLGTDLPLIIIAHAEGRDMTDYDQLGNNLASDGFYLVSINRGALENSSTGDEMFYEFLQKHIKHIYKEENGDGEILSVNSFPLKNLGAFTRLNHSVALIGHSKGGDLMFRSGKDAINDLMGLDTKALIGLAPSGDFSDIDVFDIPFFIIQGRGDNNLGACGVFGIESEEDSRVGIFESGTDIHNGVERAYISTPDQHYLENSGPSIEYSNAIARAFLKNDRTDFEDIIRRQVIPDNFVNILYWNNQDDLYYNANVNDILIAGSKYVTKFSVGLTLYEGPAQLALGSKWDTRTLHFSNVLKIQSQRIAFQNTEQQVPLLKNPITHSLKFILSESAADANFVRFNAGELFKFDTQNFSDIGVNPRVRLIYTNPEGATSNWINMSDLTCGKIENEQFFFCPRNIMQTYVIGLDEFTGGPADADVIGVEFDFTNTLGSKRLVFDDLAFMN